MLATCSISVLEEARDRKNSRVAENSTDFSIRRKSMRERERERDVSWNLGCVVNLGGMGRIYLVVTPVEQGLEGGKN